MSRLVIAAMLVGCGHVDFAASGDGGGDGSRGSDAFVTGDGPTGCAAHAYELCDDFEAGDFAAVWTVDSDVALDGAIAHRGHQSAHFSLPATAAGTGAFATLTETSTLPLGDPTTYVRAYIRFGALPAGNNQMEVIAASQASDAHEDALFMSSVDLAVYKQWPPEDSEHDLVAPQLGTWLCVLFTIQRATTATGSVALAGDVAAVSLTGAQTDGSPPIANMLFGPQVAAPNQPDDQPALEMWMDDVIVDKSPVTCAD